MNKDQSASLFIRTVNLFSWILLILSPFILSGSESDEKLKNKFIATYHQHFRILLDYITFSFRISGQQKLAGEIPFYFVSTYYDSRLSNDGVGGAFNLRGAKSRCIVANGFITGNFEN